jgi:hypothetical protein
MRNLLSLLLIVACAPVLMAGDNVRHPVAYPATTMVYAEVDLEKWQHAAEIASALGELGRVLGGTGMHEALSQNLAYSITPGQVDEVLGGISKISAGLLDVGLSGPRWQVVVEGDAAAVMRTIVETTREENQDYIPDVVDHFGTPLYQLRLLPMSMEMMLGEMAGLGRAWVAFVDDRLAVISSSRSATADAVDALEFPDDDFDTLAGTRRFQSAVNEFEDPHALLFVNIPAVINAIERFGEGGRGMMGGMLVMVIMEMFWMSDESPEVEFFASLLQYEQLNAWAFGLWYDHETNSLVVDAVTDYLNMPEYLEATRLRPGPRRIQELFPAQTFATFSLNADDVADSYRRNREYILRRARNAGLPSIEEWWQSMEESATSNGVTLEDILEHLQGEQVAVAMSESAADEGEWFGSDVTGAYMFEVKDLAAAQRFIFSKVRHYAPLGFVFSEVLSPLGEIEYLDGVEIYSGEDDGAMALLPLGDGPGGVVVLGELRAVRLIVAKDTPRLSEDAVFRQADSLQFDGCTASAFLDGAMLTRVLLEGVFSAIVTSWGPEPDFRDDIEQYAKIDRRAVRMFNDARVMFASRSGENRSYIRMTASGLPTQEDILELVQYVIDSRRMIEVREDLTRVQTAAEAYHVLNGEFASTVGELQEAGLLDRAEDGMDAFWEDRELAYALAEVPTDADIRQPVLLAYQPEPTLAGKHFAILWNGDIVALEPEQLQAALERAAAGLAIEDDAYSEPQQPLIEEDLEVHESTVWARFEEPPAPAVQRVEVVVIDEEGRESTIQVDRDKLVEETEKHLETKKEED